MAGGGRPKAHVHGETRCSHNLTHVVRTCTTIETLITFRVVRLGQAQATPETAHLTGWQTISPHNQVYKSKMQQINVNLVDIIDIDSDKRRVMKIIVTPPPPP